MVMWESDDTSIKIIYSADIGRYLSIKSLLIFNEMKRAEEKEAAEKAAAEAREAAEKAADDF